MNAKVLGKGAPVKHIAAARFHSVVATDTSVYTLGLNAGQLGHAKGDQYVQVSTPSSSQRGATNVNHRMSDLTLCRLALFH